MSQSRGKYRKIVFYRFLFTYFSLLLIAILLAFVLVRDAKIHVENEYFLQEKNHAGIIADQIDALLNRLDSLNYMITNSAARRTCMMDDSAYNEFQLVSTLYEYQNISGENILTFLCWSDRERVYDLAGTYTASVYWAHRLSMGGHSSVRNDWDNSEVPSLVSYRDDADNACLLYVYPLSCASIARYDRNGYIVHYFSPQVLAKLLQSLLGQEHYEEFALFYDEQPVWFSNPEQYSLLTGAWTVELDGEQFVRHSDGYIFSITLDHYGMKLFFYVGDAEWQNTLLSYQKRIVGMILPFIAIGILMMIGYLRSNYEPVRRVMAMLPQDFNGGHDEFSVISSGIRKIQRENEQKSIQLEEQREILRHHCLIRLLRGEAIDAEDMKRSGVVLAQNSYAVLCIRMINEDILRNMESQQKLEAYMERFSDDYLVDIDADHALFVLTGGKDRAKDLAIGILSSEWCHGTVIGIGINDEERLGSGYLQSIVACDEAMRRNLTMLVFEVSDYMFVNNETDNQLMIYLNQTIQTGNENMAMDYLDQLGESMSKMHYADQKCMKFMLINLLRSEYAAVVQNNPGEMFKAIQTDELSIYLENMRMIITGICREVQHTNDENTKKHSLEIIDYIDAHFKEYDISVEKLCQEFGMSGNRLSRLVKEQTGFTPREYIIQARMEYAGHLLKETDMLIGDVSKAVGYISVSHFIRMFKEHFGMTPNQMRGNE